MWPLLSTHVLIPGLVLIMVLYIWYRWDVSEEFRGGKISVGWGNGNQMPLVEP